MNIEIKGYEIISDNERLIPIIVNNKPRLVTSAKYKKCKKELIKIIQSQMPEHWNILNHEIEITIRAYTYKDVGNIIKVISDALEGAEVINNDRFVSDVHIHKVAIKRGQPDTVYIEL